MTTAQRFSRPAAVAALAAAAFAIPTASASAARNDECANARAAFNASMNQARYWIGAADRLSEAGYEFLSWQATERANAYLDQASGHLGDMTVACG